MKTKIAGIAIFLLSLAGCVKETLDKCKEGNVRINVYAEKFQSKYSDVTRDIEPQFGKRIEFMHCILYQEDNYVLDTVIDNVSAVKDSHMPIDFHQLPFGNYNLVIIGNCLPETMSGDFHRRGGMLLLYPGADKTEDMFASVVSFTVDCDCTMEFSTKLLRLLGVVRCEMNGLADDVSEIEVIFHNINSQCGDNGVFSLPIDLSRRIKIMRTRSTEPQSLLLGVFPTLSDKPATYEVKLYSEGQTEPTFSKVMSDKINILRNQYVELISDFSKGEVQFTIRLDTQWDDHMQGGEVEID